MQFFFQPKGLQNISYKITVKCKGTCTIRIDYNIVKYISVEVKIFDKHIRAGMINLNLI